MKAVNGLGLPHKPIWKTDPCKQRTKQDQTLKISYFSARTGKDGLTNNLEWSPWTIAQLYRARWEIEVFFKELKQTLKLVDFIGYSQNAVEWQIWMALLVHLLMRFLAHLSKWERSFTRLFTLLRASLWHNYPVRSFLESYGPADTPFRLCACPNQLYLPGIGATEEYPVGQQDAEKDPRAENIVNLCNARMRRTLKTKGKNDEISSLRPHLGCY
jgi:hypothetical protein